MVVFAMMLMLLVQLTSGVNESTQHQMRSMEAIGSARVALDTLAQDLGTLITRGGTTLLFKQGDATTNDLLRFLCISRPVAGSADSRLYVVGYSVAMRHSATLDATVPMLVRGSAPVGWPASGDTTAADYDFRTVLRDKTLVELDAVAERVFRFEIVWLRKDGSVTRDPRGLNPDPDANVDANGYIWVDLREMSGLIVSIATLDGMRQRQIAAGAAEEGGGFVSLQSSFAALENRPEDAGKTPATQWNAAISSVQPEAARENLRILQRTYYLP